LTLSVFEPESDQKYEKKYDIDDIRPYLIRFHLCVISTAYFSDPEPGILAAYCMDTTVASNNTKGGR